MLPSSELVCYAIHSKMRGCDLVKIRLMDVAHGERVVSRATGMQQKTAQPVRFELTKQTRASVQAWIARANLSAHDYRYTEGFSYFVTSITAPIAHGCSDNCRVGFSPTEKRRL